MLNYLCLFLYAIIPQIVISSPSLTSPREAIKLSSGRTMVANWKLNKDMYEQPSPVSVLDLPSHAESSNSVHFSDIRSRLHGKGFVHLLHLRHSI